MSQNTLLRYWRMGARATALLTVTVSFFAVAAQAEAQPALGGTCEGVRLAPHATCVSSYWVNANENWLIAAEDEAMGGTLCVYLSRLQGRTYAWAGSPASCNTEPATMTQGSVGHPTVYNGSNHWVTALLAIWR